MKAFRLCILLCLFFSLAFCASSSKKAALKQEQDPQYQYEKGVVSMNYGLEDQAILYLKKALELKPDHVLSLYLLGLAYIKKEYYKEAVSTFVRYLELQPGNSKAHFQLGTAYEKLETYNKAEEEYKKAYASDKNPDASFSLARLYFRQNKLEPALEAIRWSIADRSNSAPSYNLQGVILNTLKKVPEAIVSFQKALSITPGDISISVNLGIAYINNRQPEKARPILEKILPRIQDPSLKEKVSGYIKLTDKRPPQHPGGGQKPASLSFSIL